MKTNQPSGFAHMALIAAVVVVAAVAAVGYFVVSKNDKNTQNKSTTSNAATSSAKSSDTADQKAVKAAAKEHFALVYQKKAAEAYQVTCQDFRDLTSYTAFQSLLDRGNYYSIDLSAIEYTSVDVRNDQAKISGPVGPLQPDTNLEVSLLKKNGEWCVFGYEAKAR